MSSLLDDLNPAQREAVTHGGGPLLVLAGAGSGKTRVLTYRVAHLLAAGSARPGELTAVTFTNRAAREMRERVERLVGAGVGGVFLGTFHRWALDILRRHPREAGLPPTFAILDRDDQRVLVARALADLGQDPKLLPPRAALARISALTNRGLEADALGPQEEAIAAVWRRYRRLKREAGAVDFDDMLVLARKVLRTEPAALDRVRARARWLLVDEFQDTNRLQLELLRLVVDGERSITAVGDEDQSIYGWRGAEVGNILAFEEHFPGARVVLLEQTYRSTRAILAAASGLIANNAGRRPKRLVTSRGDGDEVLLFVAEDDRGEARWIVDRVEELAPGARLGEIAILLRTNAQTRPFEEELARRQVPYQVVGGLRFWQRAEVKDALAYLRLVVRPDDELAFRRVVNVPARGIGAATLDALEAAASTSGEPLPLAARRLPDRITRRARLALSSFFELLDEARRLRATLSPGELVGWLLESSGLLGLYQGEAVERVSRRENLEQLAAAVAEAARCGDDLERFLDQVALLEGGDEKAPTEALSLMTLHAAKGLEFDVVFLAGLEEGLLPHANVRNEPSGVEEERRLAYVGMTRARRSLALTAARRRSRYGTRVPTRPSPFLLELPVGAYRDVSDVAWQGSRVGSSDATRPAASPPGRRASAARPVAATARDADGVGWRPGERVRHRRFGGGIVLACHGRGPQLKLVVYFDRAGRKTLVPTIARLEKV